MRFFWLLLIPGMLFGRFMVTNDLCQRGTVGPEGYYFERDRAGGTHQDGLLWGFRASYERIRGNGFYFGGEGHWARGTLRGHSRRGTRLNSRMTVGEGEGRLGWTFQMSKWCWRPSFTPVVGIGFVSHCNRFQIPSPMSVTLRDNFGYLMAGFLSKLCFGPWSAGVNFRVGFMYDARSKISGDPFFPDVTLHAEDKKQYVLDLPLTWHIHQNRCWWELNLVPFWRYRHLGGRENFPVDFFDTVYQSWGARLTLGVRF